MMRRTFFGVLATWAGAWLGREKAAAPAWQGIPAEVVAEVITSEEGAVYRLVRADDGRGVATLVWKRVRI